MVAVYLRVALLLAAAVLGILGVGNSYDCCP